LGTCFKKRISPTVGEAVPEGGMFITSGILVLVLRALHIQILAYCTYIGIDRRKIRLIEKQMPNVVILKN
jgi:hypothetical protein